MILILKHVLIEGPGSIGTFLKSKYPRVCTAELSAGAVLPDSLDGISAVICLGGPMNVYEETKYPFLKQEDIFIKEVVAKNVPFIGICLGAQLLSKACSGIVTKNPVPELGWSEVTLTPEGAKDPLFNGLSSVLSVFQWHEDTFSIPSGAVLLATSKQCRNQAFRVGKCAYGLQFHVEVTPDMVVAWVAQYISGNGSDVFDKNIVPQTYNRQSSYEQQAQQIYRNFEGIIGLS